MINFFNNNYYCIYSDSSRFNGSLKIKMMIVSGKSIFDSANFELNRSGQSFEDLANIQSIFNDDGDFLGYERELTEQEIFELCLQKLGDDGRLFEIFSDSQEFLQEADCFCIRDDAKKLIEIGL